MFSHNYTKGLISLVLVVSFLIPSAVLVYPYETEAAGSGCAGVVAGAVASVIGIAAAEKITGVPVSTASNTAGTVVGAGSSFGTFFKDCILIPIAIRLAKAMLQNITMSIVDWINNDFNGSPSFVQDFNGLLSDTTDQAVGDFISTDLGGGFLCQSFSLQIKIALAQSYLPYRQRSSCTLSQITNNVNGFIQGDNNGGWNNWLQVTTVPQNNVYGATILAQDALSEAVANKLGVQNKVLDWGKGFRSWQSCDEYETQSEADTRAGVSQTDQIINSLNSQSQLGIQSNDALAKQIITEASNKTQCKPGKMTTKTPGSVVENQLELSLGTGVRQLEIAQDIDAIIGALTNQLMSKVVSGAQGLLGIGGSSSSGGSSSVNYSDALSGDITDPALAKAIDTGVSTLSDQSNIQELTTIGTTTLATQNTSTSTVPIANNATTTLSWSVITPTNTLSSNTPLQYETALSADQATSSLVISTSLERTDGTLVPFLDVFQTLQLSYGRTNGAILSLYISSPTDATRIFTGVSVDPKAGFLIKYNGPEKIASGSYAGAIPGNYNIVTTVGYPGGEVLETQIDTLVVQ